MARLSFSTAPENKAVSSLQLLQTMMEVEGETGVSEQSLNPRSELF